jgi:hypothetical protein
MENPTLVWLGSAFQAWAKAPKKTKLRWFGRVGPQISGLPIVRNPVAEPIKSPE